MLEELVSEALDLASGSRIRTGGFIGHRTTVSKGDVAITRKTILLFLEHLDPETTVAELRECLDQ